MSCGADGRHRRRRKIVRLGKATARIRRSAKRVLVTGSVTRLGSAPLLVAAVKVVRGGRTVASTGASLRGDKVRRGTFSLPVPVSRCRGAARVR